MAELPKYVESAAGGNDCSRVLRRRNAAKNKKTGSSAGSQAEKMSALERLFRLVIYGISINPEEYRLFYVKIILLGFFIFGMNIMLWSVSSIYSPNRTAFSVQYIPINGTASQDTKKVEVLIQQVESKTYWDGKCWVGAPNWLLCGGTTSWSYVLSVYFSESLTYNIKSRSTDISGNVESPSNGITFVIDTKPPYSYFTLPEYNGKTYSDMPVIYGIAADSKSGVAMVRVRLKDMTDGTYWDGKSWNENEIWLKMSNTGSFEMPVNSWKINHYYNVKSQSIDFAGLEEGENSGCNFYIVSALKLSAKTQKQVYNYGEPVSVEIDIENASGSAQVLELPSEKIYDFSVDSVYDYSAGKLYEPLKTAVSFNPGIKPYYEKIDKIIPVGQHLLTAEVESLKLVSKNIFTVISDTVAPSVELQTVADGQYRYFSIPVAANIRDNASVKTVALCVSGASWQMTKTSDNLWTGAIPADYNTSASISYYIEAVDIAGNKTVTGVNTISTRDIPAPDPRDILVQQQENTALIGLRNFSDLNGVYYRVYYDRGSGTVDYSAPIGILDSDTKTTASPVLKPGTNYKFSIVPSGKDLPDIKVEDMPAPVVLIKTPAAAEPDEPPETGTDTLKGTRIDISRYTFIKSPAVNFAEEIEISSPSQTVREKIISERPAESVVIGEPVSVISKNSVSTASNFQPSTPEYFITISYADNNRDGYLDGTNIRETTLVILRYDEPSDGPAKWTGGFETVVNTETNECYATVDRTGTYAVFSALRIYPMPVANLNGEATEKKEAKLTWIQPADASNDMYNIYYKKEFYYEKTYDVKYRIYWDKGRGTVDYSQPFAELKSPLDCWVSQSLDAGFYKFCVRVADIEGTEEQNTDYVVVSIDKTGAASASIRIPKDGKRLRGNAVTVIADATPDTAAVVFQYRDLDGNWNKISSTDNKPPYAVYWNLTGFKNGEYKLRAVAYDLLNLADRNPAEITVYVDDVNWDISEDGNPSVDPGGQHRKYEKITGNNAGNGSSAGTAEVMTADGTGAVVPEGIIGNGTPSGVILEIKTIQPGTLPAQNSSLESIGVFREYNFSNGKSEFEREVTLFMPYPDENDDGIIDGTGIKSTALDIYYLDEKNNEWKKADNRSGLGDGTNPGNGVGNPDGNSKNGGTNNPNNKNAGTNLSSESVGHKTISARVNHFTKFGIFAKTPKSVIGRISVYPNPFKPSSGDTAITFDGLTANIRVKIYTVSGRIIDEFETVTDGSYNWIPGGDISSGIYIYYIEDAGGTGSKKGKLAVIR